MSDLIVDILERNLKGPRYHNASNHQIAFDCPMCSSEKGIPEGDGKGNLEVNYEKRVFKCWACQQRNGMSGSLRKLLRWYGSERDLAEFDKIFPKFDISKWEDTDPDAVKENKKVTSLPQSFKPLKGEYKKTQLGNKCMYYLKEIRGVDEHLIDRYNVGYVDHGPFKNRLLVPSYDKNGEVNFFVTRAFGNVKQKYLNPSADKNSIVFNEYYLKYDFPIYLVEGVFDHLITPNSVPLLGNEISDELLMRLYDNANSYVIVFFDPDAHRNAIDVCDKLNVGRLCGKIRMISLKGDMDPSKYYKEHGKKDFFKLLKTSYNV